MKVATFITARLKSTRLPKKVLKPIQGRPMLSHMIERLRLARRPQQIVLCTSTVTQDDPLAELAEAEGIALFRGHPDDVLLRLAEAARAFDVDVVASCTADCPFVDPIYLDRLVNFHIGHGYDYSNTAGLPFGAFAYALSRPAIERACALKDETDTEVWGGYFTQSGAFRTGTLAIDDPAISRPALRLTVDEAADFELVSRIFEALYQPGRVFSLEEIVALCDRQPTIAAINAAVRQKPAPPIRLKADRVRATAIGG
ncbi:MAG: glycosyltransferase family protein [Alphaproteobacteria bacterium]|jgi:spore coat polysaccharide biosynthesis protein SpsF|nr:glycosyltransferase family protein [Alphaproteobacteria bacterium]